jgi:hypothetical protein
MEPDENQQASHQRCDDKQHLRRDLEGGLVHIFSNVSLQIESPVEFSGPERHLRVFQIFVGSAYSVYAHAVLA